MPEDEEMPEDLGLTEEVDIEIETMSPEPKVSLTPAVTLGSGLSNDLKSMLGDEGYETLVKVAESQGKTLEEFVKISVLDSKLGAIEVYSGKNRGPHNMVVVNAAGDPIDLDDTGMEDAGRGYQGYSVGSLYDQTVEGYGWSPGNLGSSLAKVFGPILKLGDLDALEKAHENMLGKVRSSMTSLGEVFGFDNYEHLEMFFAAWLMKDSTCRLSGIPGTGKTTVIESAAILLCNSYGYGAKSRYVSATNRQYTMDEMFGDERAYTPQEYLQGQDYHLTYSNVEYENVANDWDEWRFTGWEAPTGSNRSGAYNYDFPFLHQQGKGTDDEPINKIPLKDEDFYKLLNNCWVAQAPSIGFSNPDGLEGRELLASFEPEDLNLVVAPIKLLNADGKPAKLIAPTYKVADIRNKEYEFEMTLRFPEVGLSKTNDLNYEWILSQGDAAEFMQTGYGLFTDAGRCEGYGFRNYLQTYFYDARVREGVRQGRWKPLLEEMLRENGVAKIDYEKRADEVLYGIEIQQSTKVDPTRGSTVSTYEFEPVPRPIVTQPIKFFNEANRSQAGVEDAVLGLIAERKVEYRGKTFSSPSFVAWMDTNPHQKGNDLAFIDRIDMELLFKTVSLGARYTQLSGRFGGGGLSPQDQLVKKLAEGGNIGFEPMRFNELRKVWNFVLKTIGYAPPGQTPGSSTYDALREISYISVLFTQRFMPRNNDLKSGRDTFNTKASSNFFESPLMDFSTTTNTNEDGLSQLKISQDMKQTYESHTPFNIDRVLGFRFTNSLVKLSSALAFLRGKSYVGRKEILDGLPYVTAHRLGRAKSSKGEISGMDGTKLNYNNEQEWIREAIVNGYLLQDINIGYSSGGGMPVMDTWELYYRRCVDALKSAPALFWYEQQVLQPLHARLSKGGSAVGQNFTPVHWHIATMVVENERTATSNSATKPYRIYQHGDGTENNYQSNKNYYLSRVTGTPNTSKPKSDQNLYDYYQLRGEICAEPNLFSDDRDDLLDLLASKMAEICGGPALNTGIGNSSKVAVVPNANQATKGIGTETSPFDHDTTKFMWRTYQDSIGSWGRLLQSPGTANLSNVDNQFIASQTNLKESASFADQSLMITGRMEVREPTKGSAKGLSSAGSLQRNLMVSQVQKLTTKYAADTGEGVIIKSLESGDTETITFDTFMRLCADAISAYPAREDFTDTAFEVAGISFNMNDGLMACFPLKHSAGAPTGSTDFTGEDSLRLWVRLFQSDKSAKKGYTAGKTSVPFVTLNLTMGITSNSATKDRYLNIVPLDDEDRLAYQAASYQKDFGKGTGDKKGIIQDSGNLSKTDVLNYQVMFSEAISNQSS